MFTSGSRFFRATFGLGCSWVLVNCGGSSGSGASNAAPGAGVCGAPSAPVSRTQSCPANSLMFLGAPDAGVTACTLDADCMDAEDGPGHCLHGQCGLDECLTDDDCGAGQACGCGSEFSGDTAHVNQCVSANCRVDADCGSNGVCSESKGGYCGGITGFYCHTASDQCQTDADCCEGVTTCAYQPSLGSWRCQPPVLCTG